MKNVLFYRDFRGFTGGHLKVWDYFNHVRHSRQHVPQIYFSKRSRWDASNPWRNAKPYILESGSLAKPDLIFLAGMDWLTLTKTERECAPVPIINLIQHVRHADPENPRYTFLKHKAIRICVSEEVAQVLRASRQVEGPLFVIPYGLPSKSFPQPIPFAQKDLDILIVANKRPKLGRLMRLFLWRPGRRVYLLDKQVLRPIFLTLLKRAKMTLFLPHAAEGFYLPALEGMAVGTLVLCPDCIGNRSFCQTNWNSFRPNYNPVAILNAVAKAGRLEASQRETILTNASQTFAEHNLPKERTAFLDILENVDQLW